MKKKKFTNCTHTNIEEAKISLDSLADDIVQLIKDFKLTQEQKELVPVHVRNSDERTASKSRD